MSKIEEKFQEFINDKDYYDTTIREAFRCGFKSAALVIAEADCDADIYQPDSGKTIRQDVCDFLLKKD